MSSGSICTADQQHQAQITDGSSIVCLTRGDSIGLTLVAESGFISLVALIGVFILIFRNMIRSGKLIQRPTDIYMLSLFSFDIIMALGRVTDVKWIHEGIVYLGGYCTAQGVLQQLGETGSALATLAIAIHTFVVVLWGKLGHQFTIAYFVVGFTWVFIGLFVAISVGVHTHGNQYYETPDGYWCWIGNRYKAEQYAGQYVWVWTTVFVSFLAYTPLFFWARGNITVNPDHWWKIKVHKTKEDVRGADPDGRKRRSIGMIAYPLMFAIITLPLSVVRWRTGFGSTRRKLPTATFAVEFLYSLSGALNVLLFLFTRSGLLLPANASRKNKKRGMWVAPEDNSGEGKIGGSEIGSLGSRSRLGAESRQRSRGDQPGPVSLLPGTDDVGWDLPVLENREKELV